ncbi:MAG: thermonuclease family protein [Candidatus Contendobacter sp.]|nr:thermonuclease family protein [Candidatus Contendobacter sp.]MDS4057348.1 thermonuclease family protein [Candidatus Contendobacter sp.]
MTIGRIAGRVFLLLVLTVAEISVAVDTLTGRVVNVADGDTLTVLMEGNRPVRVRLAGIDAPEHDQPFGQRSRQSLAELTLDRPAAVMVWKTDDYGRTVGTVTVGGVDVEAEQVRRGLAWVYRHYSDDARLLALEAEAKAA